MHCPSASCLTLAQITIGSHATSWPPSKWLARLLLHMQTSEDCGQLGRSAWRQGKGATVGSLQMTHATAGSAGRPGMNSLCTWTSLVCPSLSALLIACSCTPQVSHAS
jgi:hypothetical protein